MTSLDRHQQQFATEGFVSVPGILTEEECESIAANGVSSKGASAGTRCLLAQAWCISLVGVIRRHPVLSALIPPASVAVQCTYFEKLASRNWLVPSHQDLGIPVAGRIDDPALRGWSEKEGSLFVQAPAHVLEQMAAVRIHLDECGEDDGPLRVVPGSHLHGRIEREAAIAIRDTTPEVMCLSSRGGALVLRPLILHRSSRSGGTGRRRVLHFVFGPRKLPHGLRWRHAI